MIDLTVIITASYLKSHPSIRFIQQVLESLRYLNLSKENTKVILTHDNINNISLNKKSFIDAKTLKQDEIKKENYNEYLANIEKYCSDILPYKSKILINEEWGCITTSIYNSLQYVETKYMLILQQDIAFVQEVPIYPLIELMENNPQVKHLRYNVRQNLPIWNNFDGYKKDDAFLFKEVIFDGIPLCYTPAWSDQSHIVTKEYYEKIILPDCSDENGVLQKDFMEHIINPLCHKDHERYGTYIYGAYGIEKTTDHIDGRETGRTTPW
jgi:hypothetical protein